jgi:hypothetical protein
LRSLHPDDVDALDQPLEQAPVSRSDSTCDDASLLDRLVRRTACRELRLQRNLIAHGVWMVDDAGIPHVTWHSHFLESDDYAVVRSFSYEDFDSFLESARAVLNAFDETKRNLEELLPGKWPAITEMGAGET